MEIIEWDIYELGSEKDKLQGVKCRRRIREFAIKNKFNVLAENAVDLNNVVRFAVVSGFDISDLKEYLNTQFDNPKIKKIDKITNPVLSSLRVNYSKI